MSVQTIHTFWVNGTKLAHAINLELAPAPADGPSSPFPYKRLGGASPFNATFFYIYHQMNDTTFAEDHWDETTEVWTSNNVTIFDA